MNNGACKELYSPTAINNYILWKSFWISSVSYCYKLINKWWLFCISPVPLAPEALVPNWLAFLFSKCENKRALFTYILNSKLVSCFRKGTLQSQVFLPFGRSGKSALLFVKVCLSNIIKSEPNHNR